MGRLRRAGVSLLLCLQLGPGSACAAAGEKPAAPDEFETRLLLKDPDGKEANAFTIGETVTFEVILRNRTAKFRTLTLPSSRTHDIIVSRGEREVWRWSAGRMFAQVLTEVTLPPGASRGYPASWDMADPNGTLLPAGEYRAVGLVPAGVPGSRSGPVSFTIRPYRPKEAAE
ncbi:MAG: BsuPI-related putative proteinase inhibitor [Candidatus Polarisedimenticolia bacterium]